MFKILNIFLLVVIFVLSDHIGNNSLQYMHEPRIVGGNRINVKRYPYVYSILLRGFPCGGTLISRTCILTAAHCIAHFSPIDAQVFQRQNNNKQLRSSIYTVTNFYFPIKYNSLKQDFDIAILKLSRPIKGGRTVKIDYKPIKSGEKLTVVGWGKTNYTQSLYTITRQLRYVDLMLVNREHCKVAYGHTKITNNMFCAAGKKREMDACQGDSGGPIIKNGRQVGIVSFGVGCGNGTPGVYTSINSKPIARFLKQTLRKKC